jgi:hypothetical protein
MAESRERVKTEVTTVRPAYSLRTEQAVWLITAVVAVILSIRFVFKMLAASTQSGFVRFIFDITQALIAPFHSIFNTAASGNFVFEPETLVAIVIYSLIGWGLVALVRILTGHNPSSRTDTVA